MTDNSGKWRIVEAIYKCAVVLLLTIAVILLWDIRSRQQAFPTMADLKKAGIKNPDLIHQRPQIEDQLPLVRIAGGQVTVDGDVTVDGSVSVDGAVQIER